MYQFSRDSCTQTLRDRPCLSNILKCRPILGVKVVLAYLSHSLLRNCLTSIQKQNRCNLHRLYLIRRNVIVLCVALRSFPQAKAEACGLAKIMRPAVVCNALVTITLTSPPT